MKSFNISPESNPRLSLNRETPVEELNRDFEKLMRKLMDKYKHLLREHNNEDELLKLQQEFVNRHGLIAKIEMLDLYNDLAVWINDLLQKRLLEENEAKFLMGQLKKSKGWDNFTTLTLLTTLSRMDLYLREELLKYPS